MPTSCLKVCSLLNCLWTENRVALHFIFSFLPPLALHSGYLCVRRNLYKKLEDNFFPPFSPDFFLFVFRFFLSVESYSSSIFLKVSSLLKS